MMTGTAGAIFFAARAHARHPHVGHHDVGPLLRELPQALDAARGREHGVPGGLEHLRHQLAVVVVVLDEEHAQGITRHRHSA
jgi:hypothetical protein